MASDFGKNCKTLSGLGASKFCCFENLAETKRSTGLMYIELWLLFGLV